MIELQSSSLLDLLPENLRSDSTLSAAAKAIDQELQRITSSIHKLSYFDRFDTLTDEEVNELAWQFHVDFYDPTLPIEQRRELIKKSFAWHKRKGTASAVEELVTTIFGDGKVEEWYEYGGDPFYFRVITNNPTATNEQAEKFLEALNSVKNIRSRLDAIQVSIADSMNLYFGGVVHIGDFITLRQVT